MTEITLYSCTALRARITVKQCGLNHEKGTRAAKLPVGSADRVAAIHYESACIGCPGVIALGNGEQRVEVKRVECEPSEPSYRKSPMRPSAKQRLRRAGYVPGFVSIADIANAVGRDVSTIREKLRLRGIHGVRAGYSGGYGRRPMLYPKVEVERMLSETKRRVRRVAAK